MYVIRKPRTLMSFPFLEVSMAENQSPQKDGFGLARYAHIYLHTYIHISVCIAREKKRERAFGSRNQEQIVRQSDPPGRQSDSQTRQAHSQIVSWKQDLPGLTV